MVTLSIPYHQYRSFDYTFGFKAKSEDVLVAKVFDLNDKTLFRTTITAKDLGTAKIEKLSWDTRPFLATLVEKQLIPPTYFSNCQKEKTSFKDCVKRIRQTIEQLKSKAFNEEEMEEFLCPITLGVFHKPVIDDHGHTFEKSAIEKLLVKDARCPLNREPIQTLVPNRIVEDKVEKWRNQDPIPNFSLFTKENSKLAQSNLKMAEEYEKEGEYMGALDSYRKAFQYSKNWRDYVGLPFLFERMEKIEKATLAYLYLACYQLEDEKIVETVETLERCQKGKTASFEIDLLLIELYELSGESSNAQKLRIQVARNLSQEKPEQSITLYKQALIQNPELFELYFELADLQNNSIEKNQTYFKQLYHIIAVKDFYNLIDRICKLFPENGLTDSEGVIYTVLILLNISEILPKTIEEANRNYIGEFWDGVTRSCEDLKLNKLALKLNKIVFQIEESPEQCLKVLESYEELNKLDKQVKWFTTGVSLLAAREHWNEAYALGRTGQRVLNLSDAKKVSFYEQLERVYLELNTQEPWRFNNELNSLWNKLGASYQANGQLDLAERTYRKAYETFNQFDNAFALAELLGKQGKVKECVQLYYEISAQALLEEKVETAVSCVGKVKKIDPRMQCLSVEQRMHLLTHTHLLKLSSDQQIAERKIEELEQEIKQKIKQEAKLVIIAEYLKQDDADVEICELLLKILIDWRILGGTEPVPLHFLFCKLLGENRVGQIVREQKELLSGYPEIYEHSSRVEEVKALAIAFELNSSSLLERKLQSNKFEDERVKKALAAFLKKNHSSKKLNLCKAQLGDEGIKALGRTLEKINFLQIIILEGNQIGDEGAKALGGALEKNKSLQKLDLSNNQIGEEGAKAMVASLEKKESLQKLDLSNHKIGHKGERA
ncbi:MAG: hypothetical protein K1000chlam2_01168, partial [Chlamydiae bacterium]|nr:hypothetical protein [Chlamydiota bacterium]